MLPAATNAIAEVVEICGASTLHNDDIGATAVSISAEGDGTPEAQNLGIEETTGGLGTSVQAVTIGGHATSVRASISVVGATSVGLARTTATGINGKDGRSAEAALSAKPRITPKATQTTEEEEIYKEHKVGDDATLSDDFAIIVEALAFVSQ
ncbi:hypothetical protein DEO72_LG5g1694 [Vigna unguiculata]|uniref:Uncharacterized protein n=2 Tax=Vigna unguiculata TaxID=3917 RepID=A0A4D6LXE4_VIGUN|nr:hypothetical protein DEO72_LG5g1432 [Vigna unguiculata]QCD93619.1 hypothetical protein DEO72_LG5g1694 [Vigna unguiculata]